MPLPLAPQPPPPFSGSWAWMVASDPGWMRARRAAQAALLATSTAVALALIQHVWGVPVRATAAGVMVSLFGITLVRETGRAQHLTTASIFLFSCLSATA